MRNNNNIFFDESLTALSLSNKMASQRSKAPAKTSVEEKEVLIFSRQNGNWRTARQLCDKRLCKLFFVFIQRVPFRNFADESMKSTKVFKTVKLMYPVLPVLQIVANSNIACKGGCVKNRT